MMSEEFKACPQSTVVSRESENDKKNPIWYYFKTVGGWRRTDSDFDFENYYMSGDVKFTIEWVPPTPPLRVGDVITTENIKLAPNLTVLEQEGIQYVKLGIWFYDKEDSPFEEAWFDAATVKYLP